MSGLDRNDTAHSEWDELAVGWAVRALEPDDEGRFTAHLRGCERCSASVQDSGRVLAALVEQLPLESPSPQLRTRLLAEIGKTRQLDPEQAQPSASATPAGQLIDFEAARGRSLTRRDRTAGGTRSRWMRISTLVAAAAAVLAIAGLGIWNLDLQNDRDAATSVAVERGEILQDLAAAGEVSMTPMRDGDGRAVATLVRGSSQVMLMTNGLRVNDTSDQIYVLWGLNEVGEPKPLGTFDVVTGELDMRTVGSTNSGIDTFNAYAVTLESGREAPEAPTLPMVARGQVTP
ncbi:MAG: anti-sigma factor [Actinomycetota bacterium]|nr:anti-sigma factor [Actinomycetota bacterium]